MSQPAKPKLLFICPSRSTFIDVDQSILASAYEVESIYLEQNVSKYKYLQNLVMMKWRILCSPARLIVVWFADYHAAVAVLLARVLGKKSVIMVGGYDAVCYPALGMGVYVSRLRGFCARLALKLCTHIIVNHETLVRSQNTYYDPQGHPEGIMNLVSGLRTPSSVVHNVVTTKAPAALDSPRKDVFLCVGTSPRFNDIINKGWDLVIITARRRPDLQFVIVGIQSRWMNELENHYLISSIPNLSIHPPLAHSKVLEMMLGSKYFVQASISEGMPNALMEAMLMGCVPIGSNVAGIPLIIGEHGIVFYQRDPAALEAALEKAKALDLSPLDISSRIRSKFSQETRASGILKVLSALSTQ